MIVVTCREGLLWQHKWIVFSAPSFYCRSLSVNIVVLQVNQQCLSMEQEAWNATIMIIAKSHRPFPPCHRHRLTFSFQDSTEFMMILLAPNLTTWTLFVVVSGEQNHILPFTIPVGKTVAPLGGVTIFIDAVVDIQNLLISLLWNIISLTTSKDPTYWQTNHWKTCRWGSIPLHVTCLTVNRWQKGKDFHNSYWQAGQNFLLIETWGSQTIKVYHDYNISFVIKTILLAISLLLSQEWESIWVKQPWTASVPLRVQQKELDLMVGMIT